MQYNQKCQTPIYLNNEQNGKCFRIFSATETLAASINSSTIWFASRIWYIPAETAHTLNSIKRNSTGNGRTASHENRTMEVSLSLNLMEQQYVKTHFEKA